MLTIFLAFSPIPTKERYQNFKKGWGRVTAHFQAPSPIGVGYTIVYIKPNAKGTRKTPNAQPSTRHQESHHTRSTHRTNTTRTGKAYTVRTSHATKGEKTPYKRTKTNDHTKTHPHAKQSHTKRKY
jgi:hypothetical protein